MNDRDEWEIIKKSTQFARHDEDEDDEDYTYLYMFYVSRIQLLIYLLSTHGKMVNLLNSDIVVSKLEL